jgi:hypothetical protein
MKTRLPIEEFHTRQAKSVFLPNTEYQLALLGNHQYPSKGYLSPLEIKDGEKRFKSYQKEQADLLKRLERDVERQSGKLWDSVHKEVIPSGDMGSTPEEVVETARRWQKSWSKIKTNNDFAEVGLHRVTNPTGAIVNGKPILVSHDLGQLEGPKRFREIDLLAERKKGDLQAAERAAWMYKKKIRFSDRPDFGKSALATAEALEAVNALREQLEADMGKLIDDAVQTLAKKHPDAEATWSNVAQLLRKKLLRTR